MFLFFYFVDEKIPFNYYNLIILVYYCVYNKQNIYIYLLKYINLKGMKNVKNKMLLDVKQKLKLNLEKQLFKSKYKLVII